MKKKFFYLLSLTSLALLAVACSNPAQMAKDYEWVKTECNPAVLEVVADNIQANYTMTFPESYFHPKAILEVVPVLVYEGGEAVAQTMKLQGEKINDNYTVMPLGGGSVSHAVNFPYKEGMQVSELKLRCTVIDGEERIPFPADYKIADGANITYKLVNLSGTPALAPHQYLKIVPEQKEVQIFYPINSSLVRHKELTKQEIKEFRTFLADLAKDERRAVVGTDILAYASPDGPETLNDKLSEDRSKTAVRAYDKIVRKVRPAAEVNVSTLGEDWEGFQELVKASSIEDKELILRVLSMYSDPAVREREIKNMSSVYLTLANKVLPELRRARFITNIAFTNYTDEELKDMIVNDVEALNEEALLYAATLVKDAATKTELYKKAAEKYASPRGYNNLAVCYLKAGKNKEAAAALAKADRDCPYTKNNLGVLAMRNGKYEEAARYFAASDIAAARINTAALDIYNGDYEAAVSKLKDQKSGNAALAFILTDRLAEAEEANVCQCGRAAYLRAIVAARRGKSKVVAKELEIVKEKSPQLAARAAKDIEFAKYR